MVELFVPWWDILAVIAVAWFMCVVALPTLWEWLLDAEDWIYTQFRSANQRRADIKAVKADAKALKAKIEEAGQALEATVKHSCHCGEHAPVVLADPTQATAVIISATPPATDTNTP